MTSRDKAARRHFGRPCNQLSWDEQRELDRLLGIPEDEGPMVCLDGIAYLVGH